MVKDKLRGNSIFVCSNSESSHLSFDQVLRAAEAFESDNLTVQVPICRHLAAAGLTDQAAGLAGRSNVIQLNVA